MSESTLKNYSTTHSLMPHTVGTLHFVGIGGIGMSGIAEILLNLGYKISGSDITENSNVTRLRSLGAKIYIGHNKENVLGASAVITSTAIKPDNPEYIYARENRIPVVPRADMLAEIMRLRLSIAVGGTHGKTTTTSLVAHALTFAKMDPTIINGGIINSLGTNAKLGKGDWIVAEADESDGTFNRLPATIAIVTNIDAEHLDFYGTFDAVKDAFAKFVQNIPFYGCAVLCTDHEEVRKLSIQIKDRRILTYGLNPHADVRGINIRPNHNGTTFDVAVNNATVLKDIFLPLHGNHNIQNALAAITVALELNVPETMIEKLFENFVGVKRRFTHTGEFKGAKVVDDYAHHPVEIKAVLQAARAATQNRVIAISQPHRYTRLESLFEDFSTCFNDADFAFIVPVYPAGEQPIEGINHKTLAQNITSSGHKNASAVESEDDITAILENITEPGDIVIYLGAGNITAWANALPQKKA